MDYEARYAQAQATYNAGLERVKTTPEPEDQKFPCKSRVRIADDLGSSMRHFPSGKDATVQYVYSHAYGGGNVKSYSLIIDGIGSHAWYYEHQLTAIQPLPNQTMNPNMNPNKILADELMFWLPKMSEGKTLECVSQSNTIWPINDVEDLMAYIRSGDDIQIKHVPFPDAPEGEQWHNFHDLTSHEVGIDNGWRLLLKSEIVDLRPSRPCFMWVANLKGWNRMACCGSCEDETYRVKADEHPVGSLTDPFTEQHRKQVEAEIYQDLRGRDEIAHWTDSSKDAVTELIKAIKAGKIRHVEIKYS